MQVVNGDFPVVFFFFFFSRPPMAPSPLHSQQITLVSYFQNVIKHKTNVKDGTKGKIKIFYFQK